ncbi:MAG: succinyl-diaminopimelate desuccinylase [Sphingomonadales bacterium]
MSLPPEPDVVALTQALIRCASVTPVDAGAQTLLADTLAGMGFAVTPLVFGEPPDGPVNNLFATIGNDGPHFAFAGHSDVVPAGDMAGWAAAPFAAELNNGILTGRGANDMKGALAAMLVAAHRHVARGAKGRLSFIITGDEEGPAIFGTNPMLDWMQGQGLVPDACVVGEPTCVQPGDTIKVGRRGSLNAWITVRGAQGHVAYPDRADNPITRLVGVLAGLQARLLDTGTPWFQPSNLEVTDLAVGNPATNMIPAEARARISVRFNDQHRGQDLERWIRETVALHAPAHEVVVRISGEAFLTGPGPLADMVSAAVADVHGRAPTLSTTGGTSDARFIRRLCPVVEYGLPGSTMHKADECVAVADLHALADVYDGVLRRFFV